MKKLHDTQCKLLDLLVANVADPLTIRELQKELGLSSTSVVFHHLQALENKGFLVRNPQNPKEYIIITNDGLQQSYASLLVDIKELRRQNEVFRKMIEEFIQPRFIGWEKVKGDKK